MIENDLISHPDPIFLGLCLQRLPVLVPPNTSNEGRGMLQAQDPLGHTDGVLCSATSYDVHWVVTGQLSEDDLSSVRTASLAFRLCLVSSLGGTVAEMSRRGFPIPSSMPT